MHTLRSYCTLAAQGTSPLDEVAAKVASEVSDAESRAG
jgi:hypothetical protein